MNSIALGVVAFILVVGGLIAFVKVGAWVADQCDNIAKALRTWAANQESKEKR